MCYLVYIENKYKIVYYEKSFSMYMFMYFGDIFYLFCLILYSYIYIWNIYVLKGVVFSFLVIYSIFSCFNSYLKVYIWIFFVNKL